MHSVQNLYSISSFGPAIDVVFNGPKGIVAGPNHDVFVVDTENQVIRRIDPKAGAVSTVAGIGPTGRGYGGDLALL